MRIEVCNEYFITEQRFPDLYFAIQPTSLVGLNVICSEDLSRRALDVPANEHTKYFVHPRLLVVLIGKLSQSFFQEIPKQNLEHFSI